MNVYYKIKPLFDNSVEFANPISHDEFIKNMPKLLKYHKALHLRPIQNNENILSNFTEENYCQNVLDILRASFVCNTAEELLDAFEGFRTSGAFKVVRLKNKLAERKPPHNVHANALFWPKCCRVPIVVEVQFYVSSVYVLQHRQHLAYELRRAHRVESI